ncbi:MAG: hypothetical protein HYZ28_04760 [Myxococcales bacterium]|nr:hypothetical protein [Myxococcales bacterium]
MRLLLAVALASLLWGCPTREVECRVGADCASGACRADGTCAPPGGVDGGQSDSGLSDAGAIAGAGPDAGADGGLDAGQPDGGEPDSGVLFCQPDFDGSISRQEIPMAAGLRATFRIAGNTPVNAAGALQADGGRLWDLDVALAGDQSVLVETLPMEGKWFASKFPNATYAARLSQEQDLLGVFQANPDSLLLLGVVSPGDGLYRTELEYSPPAKILSLPLRPDAGWQSTSSVTGFASGLFANYTERYESRSDRTGEVKTPFARFPVQRINMVLTRTVGFSVTTVRSFLFTTECFGTVATIVSHPNESQAEPTSAAEVRRLSP